MTTGPLRCAYLSSSDGEYKWGGVAMTEGMRANTDSLFQERVASLRD